MNLNFSHPHEQVHIVRLDFCLICLTPGWINRNPDDGFLSQNRMPVSSKDLA